MRSLHIPVLTYIFTLLISLPTHAQLFFATRSYCMPEEGRFLLEPFPIGYPEMKMHPKAVEVRRKQSVITAPQAQSNGDLEITCKIYDTSYKAIINYETRDDFNQYLSSQCNRKETYSASIKLYRNGHEIIKSSFGSECEYADVNKIEISQKDTGNYYLSVCQQTPSWNNRDTAITDCNRILRRENTNGPVSDIERKKLFPEINYELKAISQSTVFDTQ